MPVTTRRSPLGRLPNALLTTSRAGTMGTATAVTTAATTLSTTTTATAMTRRSVTPGTRTRTTTQIAAEAPGTPQSSTSIARKRSKRLSNTISTSTTMNTTTSRCAVTVTPNATASGKDDDDDSDHDESLPPTLPPQKKTKTNSTTTVIKSSSPNHKKVNKNSKGKSLSLSSLPPKDWLDVYQMVQELRQDRTAPCDHSGAEALPDPHAPTRAEFRFQVLLALMLSSQTKDAVVAAAIRHMQRDNVANVHAIAAMSPAELQAYIGRVGFHNNKTRYILETVQILLRDHDGDIPPTAAAMQQQLPGVGPKMAFICENIAWQKQSGIGVDTHMHRLFNKLGWVQSKTPEQTRVQLQAWLPKELWADVNLLWVGFGQEVQQFAGKLLRKALESSDPAKALRVLKRCGMDCVKEGRKAGLEEEVRQVLLTQKSE